MAGVHPRLPGPEGAFPHWGPSPLVTPCPLPQVPGGGAGGASRLDQARRRGRERNRPLAALAPGVRDLFPGRGHPAGFAGAVLLFPPKKIWPTHGGPGRERNRPFAALARGVRILFPGRGPPAGFAGAVLLFPLKNIWPPQGRPVALPAYCACVPSGVGTHHEPGPRHRGPPTEGSTPWTSPLPPQTPSPARSPAAAPGPPSANPRTSTAAARSAPAATLCPRGGATSTASSPRSDTHLVLTGHAAR